MPGKEQASERRPEKEEVEVSWQRVIATRRRARSLGRASKSAPLQAKRD